MRTWHAQRRPTGLPGRRKPRPGTGLRGIGRRETLIALPTFMGGDMATDRRIPLTCRLNLRHQWRTRSTEDGNRWKACARCGRDKETTNVDVHLFH
jgi:hypothetical protein